MLNIQYIGTWIFDIGTYWIFICMFLQKKYIIILLIIFSIGINFHGFLQLVHADTPTPTPDANTTPAPSADNSQQVHDLNQKIAETQGKINDLQGQEKTLSSQIAVMDSQQKLTEY